LGLTSAVAFREQHEREGAPGCSARKHCGGPYHQL